MNVLKQKNNWLGLLVLGQLILVYLLAIGVLPAWAVLVQVVVLAGFVLLLPSAYGLRVFVVSVPFYLVLPQQYSNTLSTWRPLVALLFVRVVGEFLFYIYRSGAVEHKAVSNFFTMVKKLDKAVRSVRVWEWTAVALFVFGLVSLLWARFPVEGAKQLAFLVNAALLYPIVLWVLRDRKQTLPVLVSGAVSTGAIIFMGFVQYTITLFTVAYYFWQFWALQVASLYYGTELARVFQYSNSWVTVQGEEKILRMFSVMPSSHAFAMVAVLFLAFVLPLLYLNRHNEKLTAVENALHFSAIKKQWVLWASVVLASFALILSGTRGVWLGMLPVLVVAGLVYYRSKLRMLVAPIFACMLLVVVLFEFSPITDRVTSWVRNGGWRSGTLERVVSIANTNETSNAGRLAMWKRVGVQVLHNPFGVGYGNFVSTLAPDATAADFEAIANQDNDAYNLPQRYVTAHSLYLQLLAELGVVGLVLFGLFWIFLLWDMGKAIVASSELNLENVFLVTTVCVLLWFLAYSVFDLTWLNDKILLYTFLLFALMRTLKRPQI